MARPRGSPDSRPSRRPFRVWAPAFLAALRSTGIVTLAAHAAQIDRNAPYAARRRNPVFAQQWDAAGNPTSVEKVFEWPEARQAREYLNQIRLFCSEFGLTPSSRARMVVPGADQEADDELGALLKTWRTN